jgi:4-amino-4-deoxy-L-arabinose transferase-like glycosyltransferase
MRLQSRLLAPIDSVIAALTDTLRRDRAIVAVVACYVAIWTIYGVLAKANQDIHFDSAQWVVVAREPALGYAQHPPLCAWLVGIWFSLFPVADWAYYLLGLTLAGFGLWLAWLVSGRFLDAEKRMVAFAVLTFIPFFNFHALKFDHGLVLIPLCAATTLCFIRSFETHRIGWAALAGAGAAAAMLTKYWAIFLLAGLAAAALLDQRRGPYFRSRAPWVTIGVGALLLIPHAAWLITLLPVVLLSSPLVSISRPAVRGIVAFGILFPLVMVVAAPVIAIAKLGGVEEASGPYSELLAERVRQEWRRATDKPLRLVGGDYDLSYTTAFYLPDRPSAFPAFDPQIGTWVDAARIAQQGIAMVCYHGTSPEPRCLHHLIGVKMDDIAARGPPGRRAVVELARRHLGMTGPSVRFIIVTVPPQP